MTISVLLADDHPIVRQGMHRLLEAEQDLRIVGETGDGLQAIQMVEDLHPDVLVVDLMMPGLNGLDVVRQVRQRAPHTRTIVLSLHSNESYVIQALKNGAKGYVLKESGPGDLILAIREVHKGGRYLSQGLSDRILDMLLQMQDNIFSDPYDRLTNREREVLQLSAEGLNNTEIGERLSISPRTVEIHRSNFMEKMGFQTHTDLVRFAINRGIIPLEE